MKQLTHKSIVDQIIGAPALVWVMSGFLISFQLFFINPVFFNANQAMAFYKYIPIAHPAGIDLWLNLTDCASWFFGHQPLYLQTRFQKPPLTAVFTIPLLFLDFSTVYRLVTSTTIFCYFLITLFFPIKASPNGRMTPILMLVFITGIISYGFQFELERGQYNIFDLSFCFLALYIYHYHRRYRYVAYLLFSISVQLKLYPFIFILLLVEDWTDWKSNISRFLALSLFNVLLFFILGPEAFIGFLKNILYFNRYPNPTHVNLSIQSFVILLSQEIPWVAIYHRWVELILLAVILFCLLTIIWQLYQKSPRGGLDPFLMLACMIGGLLIPSISDDYKLSLLAPPFAFLFSSGRLVRPTGRGARLFQSLLILTLSFAYSITLFSFKTKPPFLMTNLPILMVMLIITTWLSFSSNNVDQNGMPFDNSISTGQVLDV